MSQESYHRHAFLLRFTHILFSKSIPNFNAIMPSNRAGPYDHNSTTFNSVPILEGKIRNLPGFCLPILSGQLRRFRAHIIYLRKGVFNWNPTVHVSRPEDQFPRRRSAITGIAPPGSTCQYWCVLNPAPPAPLCPLPQSMFSFSSWPLRVGFGSL